MDPQPHAGLTGSARAAHVRKEVLALLPLAAPNYQESLSAGKFYAVIEKHDREPHNSAHPDPEAFLWLCAKPNLPIRKMLAHYKARCSAGDDDFVVTVAGDDQIQLATDSDAKFKDLPAPESGILLLTATRGSASRNMGSSHAADPPTSAQKAPAVVGTNNLTMSRPPLREIHRQTSTPSKSQGETPLKSEPEADRESFHLQDELSPWTNRETKPIAPAPEHEKLPEPARDTNVALGTSMPMPMPEEAQEAPYQPRISENPFVKDEPEAELDVPARGGPLSQLSNEETPERLEAAVQAGLQVLSSLEAPLKNMPANEDTTAWLAQISKVRDTAIKTRTVVGVVGNTGAGKQPTE